MDFSDLKRRLEPFYVDICQSLLPGGRVKGDTYRAGSLDGGPGKKQGSLVFNLTTGRWRDWEFNEKSEDIIGLYARVHGTDMLEAAKALDDKWGDTASPPDRRFKRAPKVEIVKPPTDRIPKCETMDLGAPSNVYTYTDVNGDPLFWVARYVTEQGKTYRPWSWDDSEKKFVCNGWPIPRPMYNLHELTQYPDRPVLLVEGEKCADALKKVMTDDITISTWANGCRGWVQSNLDPLIGRKITIWPDADSGGIQSAEELSNRVVNECESVSIVDVKGQPAGWDCADAIEGGWERKEINAYIRSHTITINQTNITINQSSAKMEVAKGGRLSGPQRSVLWDAHGVRYSEKFIPVCNQNSCEAVIESTPRFHEEIWYDQFHGKIFWEGRPVRDADYLGLTKYCQEDLWMNSFKNQFSIHAVENYAERHKRCEPLDWMRSFEWDKKGRIDEFMRIAFGAKDDELTRIVSKNFWLSMVARICEPGCWVDNMVVLEGFQGAGKSKALRIIGGKWYKAVKTLVSSGKDFLQDIQGAMIVEIPELASFTKAENNILKAMLSTEVDSFRKSYGRHSEEHPRKCILVGTTNDKNYMKDHTGARRYWPISVTAIDWDYIRKHREQLFAEALFRYEAGEEWHTVPDDEAKEEQELRYQLDPWEEIVSHWLTLRDEITETQVMRDALKIEIDKLGPMQTTRVRAILSRLGLTIQTVNGRRVWKK